MVKISRLELTPLGFQTYELLEDFTETTKYGTFTAPKGMSTDLASTPRILWSILPPKGRYVQAAVIHDYLCNIGYDRKIANLIFYELMIKYKTYKWKAKVMYIGVEIARLYRGL